MGARGVADRLRRSEEVRLVDVLARFRSDSLRRLVLLHVALAAGFVLWRVLENTPATNTALGSTASITPFGRALTILAIAGAFASAIAILVYTLRSRREWPACGLLIALCAALVQRGFVDAFDIVYLMLVAIAAALSFATRRL